MKTKERIIGAAWTLARIVSALAIGWLAFSRFTMTMFIDANFAASVVGGLCFGAIAFYMLKVRYWRFWVAVVIGVVLWYATMGVLAYTDPLCDEIYGHTRYFGLPLPVRRANECSTVWSIMADAKPGRAVINLLFWCFLSYAFVAAPRIVRRFHGAWRLHKKFVVALVAVLLAILVLIIVFRKEIATNWYAPRNWQSPHGHERLPEQFWPKRTWWENLKSNF